MENTSFLKIKLSFTNCYFIPIENGYLQIDTSYPSDFEKYLKEINKLNISLEEIKYLFLTHHHDDHAGFLSQLRQKSDFIMIVQENAMPYLKLGKSEEESRPINKRIKITLGLMGLFHEYSYPPIGLSKKDLIINGDNHSILKKIGIDGKILYTPGHTDDHQALVLSDGYAFAGDIAMNFLRFAGLKRRPIFVKNIDQVFQSWQKLIDNGAKMIYPAHGKPFSSKDLIYYARELKNKS